MREYTKWGTVEFESNKESVITHDLQNIKNGVTQFFKKDSVKYTKEILYYQYLREHSSARIA